MSANDQKRTFGRPWSRDAASLKPLFTDQGIGLSINDADSQTNNRVSAFLL